VSTKSRESDAATMQGAAVQPAASGGVVVGCVGGERVETKSGGSEAMVMQGAQQMGLGVAQCTASCRTQ
jgi:hypothetical protein